MTVQPAILQSLAGLYYSGAVGTLIVRASPTGLVLDLPGLPPGYEIRLEPRSTNDWVVASSMLAGMPVAFDWQEDANPAGMRLGNLELQRQPVGAEPIIGMRQLPEARADTKRDHRFEMLYQQALAAGPGLPLVYDLAYPKFEFLQYLKRAHGPMFHGSNNREIEVFAPVRKSIELFDETGRGNLGAVYATHYPVWAMFFAVINRAPAGGSINNGVFQLTNPAGEAIDLYFFAASSEIQDAGPWVDGMLYILPADTFRQLTMPNGALANEWASENPVVPLAKLPLTPDDFPFKEHLGRFDNPQLQRISQLTRDMFARADKAALLPGGISLTLPWEEGLPAFLAELTGVQKVVLPQLSTRISDPEEGNPVTITMEGPQAIIQVYSEQARERGLLPNETNNPIHAVKP